MNSKHVGNIAESRFIYECVRRQIDISLPFGDNARYDAIIDSANRLLKVQVKTLRKVEEGKYEFSTRSNSVKGEARKHYKDSVDYFFAYNEEDDIYVFMPIDIVGDKYQVAVRTIPPKNNQKIGINMVEDYQML
ncbi:hypothetical protein My1_056 [Pectobacterium phage My1]|uniref:PD(D/E)XK endonuclease domain-containing protein n=1 Tax=Pectobacterium phage My1 TaxID=1204539 RepID=J9QGQ8_9CAUD|nr:hypothetical protein My1_056 [Pectobacterium phage My1]AFQ22215.1 hypothetical protein My1_056 [Pectobacterium phage My1]